MPPPSVMVLDGESRAALGVVRSLGALGVPVLVGGDGGLAMAGFSRFCSRRFAYPLAAGLAATHAAILERVRVWRPDVLMPVMEPGWEVTYAFYDEYAALTRIVPNPGRALFEGLFDKAVLAGYAEPHGVPMPATWRPRSREEALGLSDRLPYPVLLKPRRSSAGVGTCRVEDPAGLAGALGPMLDPPLIQEYIDGEDLELTVLCAEGAPVAGHVYLTLRNYPLPFGPPIACRTIRDDALLTVGIRFLEAIGYHGVAHLDFRRDRRDGVAKLLDFNPRLAGTNDISIRSGVNFPKLLYDLAVGGRPEPCFEYDVGLEYRWLVHEVLRLLRTPEKGRTLRELLRWRCVASDVWPRDLLPHVAKVVARVPGLAGPRAGGEKAPQPASSVP